jgi:N-acetylglucosamine-6-phosphate deacetylase
MAFALTGARVFDGRDFLEGHAVLVEGRHIAALSLAQDVPSAMRRVMLPGGLLAPGFIDVQVNGGGGALLNATPTVECVRRIAESHRIHGTVGLLPTVITDTPEIVAQAIAAVRAARAENVPGILGMHVEGPFLDPVRKGAHHANFIRNMTDADATALIAAGCGVLMLTLAPNRVPPQRIRQLTAGGIRISLGHSEATFAEARAALDAGASAFTHLFNAMSQLTGREPGMVGAALADQHSFLGLIADGLHVHDATMHVAVRAAGPERVMLISDAMPPAAGGPDRFVLQGREVSRHGDRLELADGTLAGSLLTMDVALRHCVENLALPLGDALCMASANPARFLGIGHELGRIAPGALASLVHLDDKLHVLQTWIEGT